jgi:hypothetical protein
MATNDPHERPQLSPAVVALLRQVRRRIRRYVWLEGGAAVVAVLGLAFWATLAADWLFEPPWPARVAILGLVAAAIVVVVFRRLGRRVFVRISDSNVATVLERRFPQLNDSLLTAVACSADDDEPGRTMLAETCREAQRHAAGIDPRLVFNPRPLRRNCGAAALLTISVLSFAVFFSTAMGVWARRALELSDEIWPRTTWLAVVGFPGGVQKVARGSDLEVVATADTQAPRPVPEVVQVRYRTPGGAWGRATMDRRGVARGPEDHFQEYAYTFHSILSDIEFDVVGGDARVSDRRILAVDSPTIGRMLLHCELPAYIRRKQPSLPVTGVMQVPMGSRLTVEASEANKELVRVDVGTMVGDRLDPATVLTASGVGQTSQPPGQIGNLPPGELAADRRGFTYRLGPLWSDTTLQFFLSDTDGITGRDPVSLALVPVPDQPPQVAAQLDGIGASITPQARVPVAGRVTDDYGIGRVWFDEAVDAAKPREFLIARLAEAPTVFPLSAAALEVRDLGVKPGQKVQLSVMASDLCDLGHGPNTAGSERWQLEIVTPEQLRAILEARELVLRQRLEQIIQETTEGRDVLARLRFDAGGPAEPARKPAGRPKTLRPAGAEPGDEEPAESPARQRAVRLLAVQGALTDCRKSTQEVLGLAEAFDDIHKQLVNNRIDTEELKKRLQHGIAEPLHVIAETMFPELDRRLEALQVAVDNLEQGPLLRNSAEREADEILLAMRKVLDRMIEMEDFNEVIEMLRNIIQSQDQIHDKTHELHKQRIRDLLKD